MTTASSLPYSAMEVPVLDDSMEMASPYQGHADDFDIDLDVMEDQASTTDKDMMGDDDYQDDSYDMGFEPNGANDADMIDDIAEPAMIDADEQYQDVDYNAEMEDGTDKIHEAEMLEDDYDEDIDAPVPESSGDLPISEQPHAEHILPQEPSAAEQVHDKPTIQSQPEIHVELLNEDSNDGRELPDQQHGDGDHANAEAAEPAADVPGTDQTEETVDQTNQAEQSSLQTENRNEKENDDNYVVVGDHETEAQEPDTTPTEGKGAEVQQPQATDHSETNQEETGQSHEHEPEVESPAHTSALYPVKVYYLDNEISLFPPAEGDASETFFLEDESLAYEPLGKLFSSCREVLRDHVGENEVLIMDLESLNIQLAEDSVHISKMSLKQIVDLYICLCHNDGVGEPEALYLTLSTRLTIAAEVSDLLQAASEGKGLSEIHSWDNYPEADAASADIDGGSDDGHAGEELHDENPHIDQDENQPTIEPRLEATTEGTHHEDHEDTVPDVEQAESLSAPGEDGSPQHEDKIDDSDNIAQEQDTLERHSAEDEEVQEPSIPEQENRRDGSQHNEQGEDSFYDSEEQHTESTATITQLPSGESVEGQQHNGANNGSYDDHSGEDEEGETHEHSVIDGEYDDKGPESNHTNSAGEPEPAYDHSAEAHDENEAEFHVEEAYEEDLEEGEHTPEQPAAETAPEWNEEDNTEETLLGDNGEDVPAVAEPELNATSSDLAGAKPESAIELAENLQGNADDLSKDSLQGSPEFNHGPKDGEGDESAAFDGHNESFPTANSDHEELFFDDGELLDLGISEEFDALEEETSATPIVSASVKRQRDAEDELELAESPSPDAKRSRSS